MLGGISAPVSCTPSFRSRITDPGLPTSAQVMVRLFPSTTVTAPTGSMVTWANTAGTPTTRDVQWMTLHIGNTGIIDLHESTMRRVCNISTLEEIQPHVE